MQNAIAENAYRRELARERGRGVVVGVNKYAEDGAATRSRSSGSTRRRSRARSSASTAYKAAQDRGPRRRRAGSRCEAAAARATTTCCR